MSLRHGNVPSSQAESNPLDLGHGFKPERLAALALNREMVIRSELQAAKNEKESASFCLAPLVLPDPRIARIGENTRVFYALSNPQCELPNHSSENLCCCAAP